MSPENPEGPTLRALVAGYLAEQCQVIVSAEGPLRTGANVIHPTRVAIRRLRSTLRVFAELVDVPQIGLLEGELVWFAGLLGQVRDLDILEKRLRASIANVAPELVIGPVESQLQEEIAARRAVARRQLQEALDDERYCQLLSFLDRWRQEPPLTEAADRPADKASGFVKRADKKLRRRLAAAVGAEQAGDPASDELLHGARKAGKRHRYAVELAAPVLGAQADEIIADRKALQDVLGDYQDSVVSAAFLREVAVSVGSTQGHNGFTYGLLYAGELDSRRSLAQRLQPYIS